MSQDDKDLHDLCRQVAAGIPGAREELSQRVAPLMELLAKRSLAASRGRGRLPRSGAPGGPSNSASRPIAASADRGAKIARLSDRLCRSLIEKVCGRHRHPGAETCVYRPPWPTKRGLTIR